MQYRNDLDAVRKNAHAMLRYLDYLTTKIRPDGLVAFGLGDWCPAGRGCGDYLAPLELTDSIMAMDICRKAAEMFRRIGRQKQSAFAAELADAFRQSIRCLLYTSFPPDTRSSSTARFQGLIQPSYHSHDFISISFCSNRCV